MFFDAIAVGVAMVGGGFAPRAGPEINSVV